MIYKRISNSYIAHCRIRTTSIGMFDVRVKFMDLDVIENELDQKFHQKTTKQNKKKSNFEANRARPLKNIDHTNCVLFWSFIAFEYFPLNIEKNKQKHSGTQSKATTQNSKCYSYTSKMQR